MTELLYHPAVISAMSVAITLAIMKAYFLITKKKLNFDITNPTVSKILEFILNGSQQEHPVAFVNQEVAKLPKSEMAELSKFLSTDQPVQRIYDTVTGPARKAGEKDASGWLGNVAKGVGKVGISALAQGLAKKWF